MSADDEYCSFTIHGVKVRDVVQFDELGARLISARGDLMKVRKDTFYFSLFYLRHLDDFLGQLKAQVKTEVLEEVMKAIAAEDARRSEKEPCKTT